MNNNVIGVIVALFTISGLPAAAFETGIGGSFGTFIVGVPTSDGLVIAADTRRTMNGLACDFGTKLYVPKNLPSTVFGFTGLSGFYAIKPFSTG